MKSIITISFLAFTTFAIQNPIEDDDETVAVQRSGKLTKDEWKAVGGAAKDAGKVLQDLFSRPEVRRAATQIGKKALKHGRVYGKKAYLNYKKQKTAKKGAEKVDDPYEE